ncbi:MAG TPA: LamG-like jellyroll fold domain-containing protein, partial [Pedobacter sp.]
MTQNFTHLGIQKNCLNLVLSVYSYIVQQLLLARRVAATAAFVISILSSATVMAKHLPESISSVSLSRKYEDFSLSVKKGDNLALINGAIGTAVPSSDATLSNLVLSSGTLSPNFTSGTLNYSTTLPYNNLSITVTPTQTDLNAVTQVKINSEAYSTVSNGMKSPSLDLNFGVNTIQILVTAEDGTTTQAYSIIVTKRSTPAISSATYNVANGVLVVTGTNFETTPNANDIDVSKLTIEAYPIGPLREEWDSVGGSTLDEFVSDTNYPDNPTSWSRLRSFETPEDVGDDYVSRISGYISPPENGNYTFYLSSDDDSRLYLSTSSDSSLKVLIASVSGFTAPREWTKFSTQKSATISLVAGQSYYLEVLHKEIDGGAHADVGWTTPSNSTIEIIGGLKEGTVTGRGQIGDHEGMALAFDGTTAKKWFDKSPTSWIQYQFPEPLKYAVNKYTVTSASDGSIWDPKDWILYGTNSDNPVFPTDYVEVDRQTNVSFSNRLEKQEFYPVKNGTPFAAYRMEITANNGGEFIHLSEIELFGAGEENGNVTAVVYQNEGLTPAPGAILAKRTLTSGDVEITNSTSFTVTLNDEDRAAIKLILNKIGLTSTDGAIYNVAAADNWLRNVSGASDLKNNGLMVSNVAIPKVQSATYDAATGLLQVTGTDFLSLSAYNNDIVPRKLTFTGRASQNYTLKKTSKTEITNGTSFSLTLSAIDKAAVNLLLNKNGTSATGGTVYNLAFAEDWAAAVDPALNVADLTGNGITVTNAGNIPVAGFGEALILEASRNEGVLVADDPTLNLGTGSFTIESWVKRGSGNGFFTLVGKQAATGSGMFLRFDDNTLSFTAGNSSSTTNVKSTSSISDDKWHHVAAVMDTAGNKMLLYIDGKLNASQSFVTNYSINSAANLGIGYKPNYGEYFDGSMDEVRIWSTARSAAEIK